MNPNHKHTEAANFLINHAIPSPDEIDAMNETDLAKFLAENGIDVPKLNSEITAFKAKLTGKMTLAQARQARLSKATFALVEVPALTQEEIIAALTAKYGRIEDMPIAARNFKSFSLEDWQSLYKDLICRGTRANGSGDART